ncbi:Hypothetical protein CINCED_3A022370 [Cinara cedri]|uniref:Uncharacterized protein n=1 Tax=Cinara cedri TaxID=506608 RepID=A0A5E4M2A5_9HEMI|nr:Hypothetical protein CINCED_3A022370 [Cinara cedri]
MESEKKSTTDGCTAVEGEKFGSYVLLKLCPFKGVLILGNKKKSYELSKKLDGEDDRDHYRDGVSIVSHPLEIEKISNELEEVKPVPAAFTATSHCAHFT